MHWLRRQLREDAVLFSVIVLFACIGGISVVYWQLPSFRQEYFEGVFVEFTGMLFDIVVFGVLIGIYDRLNGRRRAREQSKNERRLALKRQQEIIDDFKKWGDEKEGRFRIAGAVRRINELGETAIDFAGIILTRFSFLENDIASIRGSRFFPDIEQQDQPVPIRISTTITALKDVSFQHTDCRDVIFCNSGKYVPFENLHFAGADLRGAVFNGAVFVHDRYPENPRHLNAGEVVHGQFENAELAGASFKNAKFDECDFRRAKGILEADFTDAKGLETCRFDDGVLGQIRT